ncbi:amino acid adenylation domain-containing protein [Nostoc sp. CENA67]|uniref:Amino acid adenylation domain-containing protein n=2 Tax=Amazonocrinis TaxID=2840440 RepID=A0A8J7HU48_9NOST|nr:amino acid adenylation domain-containing protein [Amazonocrinis nigriterrae CENA67]
MMPDRLLLLESLPITPNGKVDRQALPAPDASRPELAENFVPPRTPIETGLAEIWAEVLGIERVGIQDNFLELGGQSLLAIQVVSRIRDSYQVDLPMRSLFDSPTIAQLAQEIATNQEKPSLQAPPILPIPRNQNLPLSFSQHRLWFFEQLVPSTALSNQSADIRLPGLQNPTALEQSFNEIIRRHEIWRTTFEMADGQPVQVIHPAPYIALPVIDLQTLPPAEGEAEALRLASVQAQKPFDLTELPLLRAILVRLSETDYRLYMTMHHLIFDGVSLYNVFLQELAVLYQAFCEGKPSPLPELSIQYADFAYWQRQWLQDEILAPQLNYWQKHLANLSMLQLPTDRPRPAMETFRGARHSVKLPKALTDELKALSSREGVTLFMTLLAALKTVLARYARQDDVSVGAVISGSNRPEIAGLIGFLINNLVLRTDLSGDPSFRELLLQVREVTLGAYANQDVPFQKLVEVLRPERHLGQHPLFQVLFVLEPPTPALLSGWSLRPLIVDTGTSNMDMTLSLDDRPEGLVGYFEYNSDLFDAATIVRMVGHFQTVLEAIVANPAQKVRELPLLTAPEKQQLQAWNDTQTNYPLNICLHELFAAQVERSPDVVAVIFDGLEAGGNTLTYNQLNQHANQLAHYLKFQGVGKDVLVGICMERSLDTIVGLLGILKAGGAYVPFDPGYPKERLAFMLEDAQVSILLTQSQLVDSLPPHQAQVICLDTDWLSIAQCSQENPHNQVSPENLVYVIYTSGSTGKPKGAMNTHQGICNRLLWMQKTYGLTESDRILQKTPFSFDVSVWEFFWPLITGARLIIAQPGGHQDSSYLVKVIIQQQITTLHFVPSMLQVFLEEPQVTSCNSIKRIICSGEALSVSLQKRCFAVLNAELHNLYGPTEAAIDVTAWKCQPDSNLSIVPIGRPISNTQIYLLDSHLQPVPVGVPGELYIGGVGVGRGYLNRPELTQEKFVDNPFGESRGDEGAFITPNSSLLTPNSSLLTPNSLSTPKRLYKTGDLARYLPDGNIEYLGRLDYQVKLRGFRIELGEIEAVLSQHPDVREAIAIAQDDPTGDQRLLAYVVAAHYPERVPYQVACAVEFTGKGTATLETEDISITGICLVGINIDLESGQPVRIRLQLPGSNEERWLLGSIAWYQGNRAGIQLDLTPEQQQLWERGVHYLLESQGFLKVWQRTVSANLRNFLKHKLPDYMVPASFILLDALPLTPSGKVDRKALQQRSATVALAKPESTTGFAAPRTAIEQAIVDIWAEVLKRDQIGIRDNFLDLGGHSLLATQVISRLRSLFQVDLPLRLMFESPTVAELAEAIAQLQGTSVTSEPAITSVSRGRYRMKRSSLKNETDSLGERREQGERG